jgi:hypothetical protein
MKFPLASPPFPLLVLSSKQCATYQQLARQLLHDTIVEYDHFVRVQQRVLDLDEWKHVKSRELVSVFKQRDGAATAESSYASQSSTSQLAATAVTRRTPTLRKMLTVGTIVGSLDDVLYGAISPDADAIKIKSEYVGDELADGRVLYQISSPTEQDPFQYLALKWVVKGAVVRPRDVVYLEATGYYRLPNGRRLGYHLSHSVTLPECPELNHLGILRAQVSSCFLYRQRDDSATVEVYMTSLADPSGAVPEVVSMYSSANTLLSCWKLVWCAQNKKLAWMVREVATSRAREQQFEDRGVTKIVIHTNSDGKRCCNVCTKTLPKLRRVVACELCRSAVCSRCRTARKLAYARHSGEVVAIPTAFCMSCITRGTNMNAADVARLEYVPGAIEKRDRKMRARSEDVRETARPRVRRPRGRSLEPKAEPGISPILEADGFDETLHVETIDEWSREHSMASLAEGDKGSRTVAVLEEPASTEEPSSAQVSTHQSDTRQEMVWQMQALYAQVEQTYQLTKQTNKTIERL